MIPKFQIRQCALCVLVSAITVSGCSEEEAPPAPTAPVQSKAPAPPASTDTPDKIFPELGENFSRAAVVVQRDCDSKWTDPAAAGEAASLSYQRSLLVRRANAMLAANPTWKETSRQWFDRTTLKAYERYARAWNCYLKMPGSEEGSEERRRQEQVAAATDAWVAEHDPAAHADYPRSGGSAAVGA